LYAPAQRWSRPVPDKRGGYSETSGPEQFYQTLCSGLGCRCVKR
jgi:hypothetical protein